MKKQDMSSDCGFQYERKWVEANIHKTLSQEEWMEWYNSNCGKCIHMCEVCMFGE